MAKASGALAGLLSIASLPAVASASAGSQVRNALRNIAAAAVIPQQFQLADGQSLFPREYTWPLPDDFEWPQFRFVAFYEHSGAFRDAWESPACSVANRPTASPPAEGTFHFCMDVHLFLSVYPHPIHACTSGVTCTFSTWANHANWRVFIESGQILEKAEEFLFMMYIGARSANEHPPSCFEACIGSATFVTTYYQHGPPDDSYPTRSKTVEWYLRNFDDVPPSHSVPEHLRLPRPSHSNSDVSMVVRSTMPPAFAAAHAAVWMQNITALPDDGRPAWQVAPQYAEHRVLMHSNYAAFAAGYAPMVSSALMASANRPALLIAVPIGMGAECCALVPKRQACFGQELEQGVPLLQQIASLARFLPQHEQPQLMHITRDAHGDVIFAIPYVERVMGAVSSLADAPTRRNLSACWVTQDALTDSQFAHTVLAMERRKSFVEPVPWMLARVGVTDGPVPVVPHRASSAYRHADMQYAAAEWQSFLETEREALGQIYAAFEAADAGSGLLAPFLGNIQTAFTRRHELHPPEQGLPRLDAAHYSVMPYPDPPMPLHTTYLARVPPQQLPDGFPESLAWTEVARLWHRRMLTKAIQMNAEHDFECYERGDSNLPRHPFLCIGPGGFHSFHFTDGVGRIPFNQFLLRVSAADGRLRPMDFTLLDHKDMEVVIGQMGFSSDKELLSFLIHGARWKVTWPRQMRISHSVFSLKTRAKAVAESTAKLIDAGLYIAEPLLRRGESLSEEKAVTACSPQYSTGMGGADKTDKPWEARPCGNTSDPHDVVLERNAPHGAPDGPRALSVNDMTGLKHYPPGFEGYIPFPDPETKATTREVYAGECVMGAMATVNGTKPCMSKDDVRWMFFQINTEPCEFWIQVQYLVIATCVTCGKFEVFCVCTTREATQRIVLILYKVIPRVTNMGSRPASKIAVRFSKQINVEWRERMADHVHAVWLPKQSQALRDLLATRERNLGYMQAHPFCTFEFTDDFLDMSPDVELTAHGALTRRRMAAEMNLWMSAKAEAGTCVDYIGGRHVITGGFGTLAPHKRARCYEQCGAALAGQLSLDDFTAHNSYLVHVRDLLDFDIQLLEGNWFPVHVLEYGWAIVDLNDGRFKRIRENYRAIQTEVATRPAASFAAGFFDAPRDATSSPGGQPVMYLHMASDCRADGNTTTVFGALLEFEWRICLSDLDPRWARRHINVGESTGAAVNVATFGVPFGCFELIHGGDNRAEGPMLLGKSKVSDQRAIGNAMRGTIGYKACHTRLWFEHNSGDGLGFTDAGSRDKLAVLENLAAAFGRRRTRIDALAVPGVLEMLATILESTTDYVKPPRHSWKKRVTFDQHSASDLRGRLLEETGSGVCPSAVHQNSASQMQSLSPTPPRRKAAAPSPAPSPRKGQLTPSPIRPLLGVSEDRTTPSARECLSPTPPRASSASSAGPRMLARASPGGGAPGGGTPAGDCSPQPLTAAAARAAAALESTDQLVGSAGTSLSNTSRLELRALCSAAHYCEVQGIPRGTRSHDEWGFGWVRRFAERFELRWMTPRIVPPAERHRIERFVALALYYIVPEMKPAKRTLAKGIDQAKPPSGMDAIYGWRRVMRDCGRHEPDMRAAGRMLRGMIEQLKARCGQDVMSVDHHIPYPLQSITRAAKYLSTYSNPKWSSAFHDAIHVVVLFSLARGPRLDEWCEMFTGDTYYRRVNFSWCLDSRLLGSTEAADSSGAKLDAMMLRATNVPSKTDRSGKTWIGKHMWYKLNANPLNFPAAWARYERKYPCATSNRSSWAAFSPTGSAAAFKPTAARAALREIWVVLESEVFADMHSWHDFRATIATACSAANKSPAFTQAVVCWASPASVALYGQMTPSAMAEGADIATTVDASRHAHIDVPHVSEATVIRDLEACADLLQTVEKPERASKSSVKELAMAGDSKGRRAKQPLKRSSSAPTPRAHSSPRAPRAPRKATQRNSERLAPAPPSPVDMVVTSPTAGTAYNVGSPLHSVRIDTSHPFDGSRVSLPNELWDMGPGSTLCTVQGFAPKASLQGGRGVFVVTADDDHLHYAFNEQALRPHLSKPEAPPQSRKRAAEPAPTPAPPRHPAQKRAATEVARTPAPPRVVLPQSANRRSPRLVAHDCAPAQQS